MAFVNICNICLKDQDKLTNAEEISDDNMKWSSKLTFCVPELEWNTDCLICQACICKLEIVFEFRTLCLQSYKIRLESNEQNDMKYESDNSIHNYLLDTNEDTNTKYKLQEVKESLTQPVSVEEINDLFRTRDNFSNSVLNKKFKTSKLRDVKNFQCKICHEVLDNCRTLVLHMKKNHREADSNFMCFHCNESFSDKSILADHIVSMHSYKSETKQCQICKNNFSDQSALENHLIREHRIGETKSSRKMKKHKCLKCERMYTTEKIMKIHSLSCDGVKRHSKLQRELSEKENEPESKIIHDIQINIINSKIKAEELDLNVPEINSYESSGRNGTVIENLRLVNSNQESQAKNNSINMNYIKKLENTRGPIVKRGRKPKEKQINRCETCSVIFSTKYLLNRHVRNVHATEKLHNCDICGQKFASPVYLSAHKRYHSRERPHICSFCGKGYITASDLYHHEKIHANKRAYKCERCPKAFNTSSDLHKHRICVHVDRSEWKYVCSFCDRRFPLKTNLDTHTKTHTGERNFACHLCDRRCINRSVLLRHIESHSNVRSFRCHICNQDYKYQKSLDIHMTKAHGIGDAKIPERVKKYFCHICPKSYFANNKLQKHIRTHTGERPFACQMCDKRFIDKSYVKQHLKTAHNLTFSMP